MSFSGLNLTILAVASSQSIEGYTINHGMILGLLDEVLGIELRIVRGINEYMS